MFLKNSLSWAARSRDAIMDTGPVDASLLQIADLRQLHSRDLEALFQEETKRWRQELQWDYRPSVELIRKFIDSRALGGYAALEKGQPRGRAPGRGLDPDS